jgi:hypothetical protein
MKKVLFAFTMFVSLTAIAQDIDIEKHKISVDETVVAILDKEKRVYKILSLDNRPVFSIERKLTSLLDGTSVKWMVLTDLTNNKTNEIIDYGKLHGISFENSIVASVCNDKYKFISKAGLDEKGVTEFINGTPTDIEKIFADANLKTKNQLNVENEAMIKAKVSVKNGDIFQVQDVNGKETNVIIGSITKKSQTVMAGFAPDTFYEVNSLYSEKDNNNRDQNRARQVAVWYNTKTGYTNPNTNKNIQNEIITSDNKYFNLRGAISSMEIVSSAGLEKGDLELYTSGNSLPSRIVAKLLFNGYTFEAMN